MNNKVLSLFEEYDRQRVIKDYITRGRAIFTVESSKLQKRYTYKIIKYTNQENKTTYQCYRLYGPDNSKDYRFIGIFDKELLGFQPVRANDLPTRLLIGFLKIIYCQSVIPQSCRFYMSNKCAVCGRQLTTPESIRRGVGPECFRRLYELDDDLNSGKNIIIKEVNDGTIL